MPPCRPIWPALLSLAFLIAACAGKPSATPTALPPTQAPSPLPLPTATPSRPSDGVYVTSLTTQEATDAGLSADSVCENVGTFTLTVAGDRWASNQTAAAGCTVKNPTDQGSWQFSGDKVIFQSDGSLGCDVSYTYHWHFDGTQLSFTNPIDSCPPRVFYLTAHPWIEQK